MHTKKMLVWMCVHCDTLNDSRKISGIVYINFTFSLSGVSCGHWRNGLPVYCWKRRHSAFFGHLSFHSHRWIWRWGFSLAIWSWPHGRPTACSKLVFIGWLKSNLWRASFLHWLDSSHSTHLCNCTVPLQSLLFKLILMWKLLLTHK